MGLAWRVVFCEKMQNRVRSDEGSWFDQVFSQ
jgi:hypothetical protein